MLEQTMYAIDDSSVADLVRSHPWATLVSPSIEPGGDAVISHLPVLWDDTAAIPTILGHLGGSDGPAHRLGEHRVSLVVEGPSGYISPTWYQATPYVPSWNFLVAHFHGVPEVVDADTTYRILDQTCDHLESVRDPRFALSDVAGYAAGIAPYTTGFRLVPDRIVAKAKMSQDKPVEIIDRIITALGNDQHHANPALAEAMRRANHR